MADGCEWNPDENRLAVTTDEHYRMTLARVIVGANGQFRLCYECADLPRFKRFRVRTPIVLRGDSAVRPGDPNSAREGARKVHNG